MRLSELLNNAKVIQVFGNAETKDISKISIDSRSVTKNSLFFAVEGFKSDGHLFIADAINNGAAAVVLQKENAVPDQLFSHTGCIKILVENSRRSLAEFAHLFYSEPSKKLNLIGITGTKGKSTTAFYVKNIFQKAGFNTGLIGTVANYINDREIKSSLTTPESNEINSLLSQMVNENCVNCVMEVSSHALSLHRVDYLNFNTGIFTNITSDHMDFHKSFENYFNAKKILFDKINSDGKIILNIDDANTKAIGKDSKAIKFYYGTNNNADFKISNIQFSLEGTKFDLSWKDKIYHITTSLIGHFNSYNSTAAFASAVINGVDPQVAAEGIESTVYVPGRFEIISSKDKKVIIDFAHTADSLKQALEAVHHLTKNERPIYVVFGCGGERDRLKRPIMGEIASTMCDRVYISSDNPRNEDQLQIIDEILKGIKTNNYSVIEDREEAIRTAIFESEDNAVILLAGKGHENYQELNGIRKQFSDKVIAQKYLDEWAK